MPSTLVSCSPEDEQPVAQRAAEPPRMWRRSADRQRTDGPAQAQVNLSAGDVREGSAVHWH